MYDYLFSKDVNDGKASGNGIKRCLLLQGISLTLSCYTYGEPELALAMWCCLLFASVKLVGDNSQTPIRLL